MRPLLASLALVLCVPAALAAMLSGTIYTEDLEIARGVLVTIDTQPQQRLLSNDGTYAFDVPPGNYTLTVTHFASNETTTETVTVAQEGSFAFDLFLFPDADDAFYDDLLDDFADAPEDPYSTDDGPWPLLALVAVILALLILPYWWLRRHYKRLAKEDAAAFGLGGVGGDAEDGADGDDTERALAAIKQAGGRMTQRDLRKSLPHSEAKVSLLVAELESAGKIKKIKKGRGNILVLKK